MDPNALFSEEDAVSPVIGVILMVAITVILAATVAGLLLSSSSVPAPPTVDVGADYHNDTTVNLTHRGGAALEDDRLTLEVGGSTIYQGTGAEGSPGDIDAAWTRVASDRDHDAWGTEVTAGGKLVLSEGDAASNVGETIRLVWDAPDSDATHTILEDEWPA